MGIKKLSNFLFLILLFTLLDSSTFSLFGAKLYLSDIAFYISFLIFFVSLAKHRGIERKYMYMFLVLILFWFFYLLSSFFHINNSVRDMKYLYVYSLFFLAYIVFKWFKVDKIEYLLIWGTIMSLSVIRVWYLEGYRWVYNVGTELVLRKSINLGFGHSNTLVYPILLSIFLDFIYLKHEYINKTRLMLILLSLLIQIYSLFLLISRGGFLLFFVLLFYFIATFIANKNIKKSFVYVFVFTCLLFYFFMTQSVLLKSTILRLLLLSNEIQDTAMGNNLNRLSLWRQSYRAILDNPFWGIGAGNLGYYLGYYWRPIEIDLQAHNIILDMFLSCGIFGGLMYFYLVSLIFKEVLKNSYCFQDSLLLIFLILISFMIEPIYGSHHFSIFLGIFLATYPSYCKIKSKIILKREV